MRGFTFYRQYSERYQECVTALGRQLRVFEHIAVDIRHDAEPTSSCTASIDPF